MSFLQQHLEVALVNAHDEIIEKMERWEAHKKGLLHRAFTILIMHEDKVLLQHRKHPVFDFVFDATISSHPYFQNDKLTDMGDSVLQTLEREWFINHDMLKQLPKHIGSFTYRAVDPRSVYIEHEICHVYTCEINNVLMPNLETAHGFSLLSKEEIMHKAHIKPLLAPWVTEMIQHGLW